VLGRRDAVFRDLGIDSATDEFGDEPSVADRLNPAIDEQPREQRVIDEAIPSARLDGGANLLSAIASLLKSLPELRFGQPALGQQA
jgi:hypothetical protein